VISPFASPRSPRLAAALFALFIAVSAGAQPGLLVTTSDFQTGSLAYFAPGSMVPRTDLLLIHSDAAMRYHDGLAYVLNRLGQDNLLVLDPAAPETPLRQFSVGNGSNPQDIVFAGPGKAYVSRYEMPSLLVVDPRSGSALGEVDLSPFADADGIPEASDLAMIGTRLYVACQRLDRNGSWGPTEGSLIAVVDVTTDTAIDMDPGVDGIQGIPLAADNPIALVAVGRRLVVAGSVFFGDRTGGIEILDPEQGTSTGLLISEEDLGGDVTALALVSSRQGYVVVSDENYANHVRPVDLDARTVGPILEGHSGGYTPDLAVDGERLIVADRGTFADPNAAGLLFYDAATGRKLAGPVGVGLPPSAIAVLTDVTIQTAVLGDAGAGLPKQVALGAGYPNPFNAGVVLPFTVAAGPVRLIVRDVLGRQVRVLAEGAVPAGEHRVFWNGTDERGRIAGNGTYLVELQAGEEQRVSKVTLLK
jgi:hypothetical protein